MTLSLPFILIYDEQYIRYMYILPVIDKTALLAIGIKKKNKFDYVSKETLSEAEMLKWLEKQMKGEKEFVFYKDNDVANLFAVAIKHKVDLTSIGNGFVFLYTALYAIGDFYSVFHEPASPYMFSKYLGYNRAEKLVKQYSALFDAKGDLLKDELKELLDAFDFIYSESRSYVNLGMEFLKKYRGRLF